MAASSEQYCREKETKNLRVVEFFSGVGGLHCAVKDCGVPCSVVAAVEINTVANAVYQHNFPEVNLMQRNLEGFSADDFSSFDADMFVMSPPCQPFTRVGLKGDKNDARTNAFFNIMRNLPQIAKRPTYLLVENVKGFETSETRNFLVDTLQRCNYNFQEFLLSPMDIGIPNQRVRYFMLAKQRPLKFDEKYGSDLVKHRVNMPLITNEGNEPSRLVCDNSMVSPLGQANVDIASCEMQDGSFMVSSNEQVVGTKSEEELRNLLHSTEESTLNEKEKTLGKEVTYCGDMVSSSEQSEQENCQDDGGRKIGGYLQTDLDEESMEEYLIPDKILLKYAHMMDIVTADETKTRCFTKAYAYYVEGTGSTLRTDLSTDMSAAFSPGSCSEEERLVRLRALHLRYFTPREVANLHHFPQDFGFPECATKKQRYRLLGNSLNVTLVARLINYMVSS
ncbi:tRNA (cytosine(38)-C(5))-methyltransferase-like [Lytechinus pictus]|uniref:tRNA (cytosine(38)-C(5))-methyltransferase-like n=1 Tax=Lytechinus pictus TaxID=7653 RepID=UPI0030B9E411